MLHIVNGDSAGGTLRETGLPGEVLVWREDLSGPIPQRVSMDEWFAIRAGFLTEEYGGDPEETRAGLASQEQKLRSFTDHDRVVLWFEHDLFCQSVLIYLLSWFSRQDLSGTMLSLICIDRFPGKP